MNRKPSGPDVLYTISLVVHRRRDLSILVGPNNEADTDKPHSLPVTSTIHEDPLSRSRILEHVKRRPDSPVLKINGHPRPSMAHPRDHSGSCSPDEPPNPTYDPEGIPVSVLSEGPGQSHLSHGGRASSW